MEQRKATVVGSGVAGLTAAYILASSYEVTLYEAEDRLGGHAHTRDMPGPGGRTVAVDSGFIVHNERAYPTLLRHFRELDIGTQDAEMSMSVSCDGCGLEYAGARGPAALFASRAARRGRHLRLLAEVPVFHRGARRLLARKDPSAITFGDFLREGGFSPYFISHFALPLVAAVWSCPSQTALSCPAAYLFTFLHHHGLLSVTGSPQWKTVTGGWNYRMTGCDPSAVPVRVSYDMRRLQHLPDGADYGLARLGLSRGRLPLRRRGRRVPGGALVTRHRSLGERRRQGVHRSRPWLPPARHRVRPADRSCAQALVHRRRLGRYPPPAARSAPTPPSSFRPAERHAAVTRPALASQGRRSQPAGRIVEIPRPTLSDNGSTAAAPAVRRSDVDAGRWPDVARLPSAGPGRTAAARYLTDRALNRLGLTPLSAGAHSSAAGPRLILHDPAAFHRRIGRHGLTGFGESYMAGEWDSDDLPGALTVLAEHVDELVPATLRRLRGLWVSARPAADRNTQAGARANVRHHYDLSNDLFSAFLDPTLTYSSAVFTAFPARFESLASAQHRKIDRLLDLACVGEGTRLLETGTGWGELALRAAARGARVTTLTLSAEQAALARARIVEAGLADRVDVRLRDYRDIEGRYDAVISVEMIEAVGAEYWPSYCAALRRSLTPGGRIALQAITMGHQQMLNTASTHTFISKYIFPGGLIPSREAIAEHSAAAGLHTIADHGYGEHYAETLRLWRERFTARRDLVTALGFDAVFQRMWNFYLAYCEAGFRSRYLDVRQLLLTEGTHR